MSRVGDAMVWEGGGSLRPQAELGEVVAFDVSAFLALTL